MDRTYHDDTRLAARRQRRPQDRSLSLAIDAATVLGESRDPTTRTLGVAVKAFLEGQIPTRRRLPLEDRAARRLGRLLHRTWLDIAASQ